MHLRTRTLLVVVFAAMIAFLVMTSSAFANFAYVGKGSIGGGRADIRTPAWRFSGVPSGKTVKTAVFTNPGYTDAGWLMRPGEWNDPETHFEWYSPLSNSQVEVPLSPQPYNFTRAVSIQISGQSFYDIYVVGSYRGTSFDPTVTSFRWGGKTATLGANLKGSVSDAQWDLGYPYSWYYLNSVNSGVFNDYPLQLTISSPNYAFAVSNYNYP
jgi:hypothetical protein